MSIFLLYLELYLLW